MSDHGGRQAGSLDELGHVPLPVLEAAAAQHTDWSRRSVLAAYTLLTLGAASPLDLHPDDWARLVGGLAAHRRDLWVDRYYSRQMSADAPPALSLGRDAALCRVGWCTCHPDTAVPAREPHRFELWTLTPAMMADHLDPTYRVDAHHRLIGERVAAHVTAAGRSVLAVYCPSQVGKTTTVSVWGNVWALAMSKLSTVFMSAGTPSTILTSYGADLAHSKTRLVRNALEEHSDALGAALSGDSAAKSEFDLEGGGGMVGGSSDGPITGRPASVMFTVDDPLKGWKAARSKATREAVRDAYKASGVTRLGVNTARVAVLTRWHPDDLGGHIEHTANTIVNEAVNDGLEILRLPGLAEEDDPLGREPGEPLWAEVRDAGFYLTMRNDMGPTMFSALIQQSPTLGEGDMFETDAWRFVEALPGGCQYVRYWDLGGSADAAADQTAGVLVARDRRGLWYVPHLVAFRKDPAQTEEAIKNRADRDAAEFGEVRQVIEQEPGSGGKGWASVIVRELAGHDVTTAKPMSDKADRLRGLAAQVNAGNVAIVLKSDGSKPGWADELIEQAAGIGEDGSIGTKHDDLIDSLGGAFLELHATPKVRKARVSTVAGRAIPARSGR